LQKPDPIRPTDDAARDLARGLIGEARFAALAVIDPSTSAPMVSRIAFATDQQGCPLTLISDLSHHTQALRADPACSLLVGEPGPRGDPLTHPRLTLQARAAFLGRDDAEHSAMRAHYLKQIPKAKLYIDFSDFSLVRMIPEQGFLNGGFGRAFVLTPEDFMPAPARSDDQPAP